MLALIYSNQDGNARRCKGRRYYLPSGVTENYNVIINEENFYGQPIDSNLKRYEEIRKFTTGQSEDLCYWMFPRL